MNNHVLTVYADMVQCEVKVQVKVQYSTSITVYKHDSTVSVLVKWRYSDSYVIVSLVWDVV